MTTVTLPDPLAKVMQADDLLEKARHAELSEATREALKDYFYKLADLCSEAASEL